MKVLATSDMHGNLEGLDLAGIDLAVFAGDIAPLKGRGPWHVYDQLKWMNTTFKSWCEKWPNTKIVFVPGNHDFFPLIKEKFGRQLAGRNLSLSLASNAAMLIDRCIDIYSYSQNGRPDDWVRIYGTPWVPIISYSWAFEAESDKLKEKFSHILEGCDIVISHSPPHICASDGIDRSLQWGGIEAFGSNELAAEIAKKSPRFLFCGHIHTGTHDKTLLGDTACYNVSRVDENYEIAFAPLTLEIDN